MIYWKFKYSRTQRALAVGVSDKLAEAARKLGYAVIKEEDLEIRENESRELAYIKIQQAENLSKKI